jgi:hypothetical protein
MIDESGDSYRVVRTASGYQSTFVPHSKSNSLLSAEFYKGAFLVPDKDVVFWHETFTSNYDASGLFASIRTKPAQLDKIYVIVLFIPAKNIISFISDIETPENVDIILYNDQGMLLSQKQLREILESSTSNEIAGNNILTSPESIRALELWQGGDEKTTTVLTYHVGGIRWWAGFSPLNKDTSKSWISIIVPETALLEDVTKRWLQLGIFAPVILIIAIIMTINLVRRYSYQLKDLPHQNFINVNLQENVKKLI